MGKLKKKGAGDQDTGRKMKWVDCKKGQHSGSFMAKTQELVKAFVTTRATGQRDYTGLHPVTPQEI
jgi:hypothetical protein